MVDRRHDGTDRAARDKLDRKGHRFEFDSEVMFAAAKRFYPLRQPLEESTAVIAETKYEIRANQGTVEPYLAAVGISGRLRTGPELPEVYDRAVQQAHRVAREMGNITDYASDSLRASAETYYEQDRQTYLTWKKMGHDLEDLEDIEERIKLKYRGEGD